MSKSILITGCSTGFGFEASKYLADQGNHVYATMRNVNGKNADAAATLNAYSDNIDVIELDVCSDSSVETAIASMGDIDVLINNAGFGYGGPVESFSVVQFQQQMDLNVTGPFRLAKAVLPGMRARRSGLIIQLSSIAGRLAFPGFGVYHASKWALEGMSEALRYELAPLGIDVVLVEPGPFSTSFFPNIVPAEGGGLGSDYAHVDAFSAQFGENVMGLFADENAPTDPFIVVKLFEDLINMPAGTRPLRNLVGLDFGAQAVNDAVEPIRKSGVEAMGLSDGPTG